MRRLGLALAFCALLSLSSAHAQLAGGLMFPGPGTPASAGGGGSCVSGMNGIIDLTNTCNIIYYLNGTLA